MARKQQNEIKYLTKKELNRLFKSIEDTRGSYPFWLRDLTVFNLAYYCGLRISEVWLLKRENYNRDTGEIYVKRLKWSLNSTVRLDAKRVSLLNKYLREHPKKDGDLLFLTKTGKPLGKPSLEYLSDRYAVLAGIPGFHFHMLKHSIAVHLLEASLSIFELKNYLGHKSMDSTLAYSTFTKQMSDEMYAKINSKDLLA